MWGQNFPREYDSFKKTEIDGIETPYGGSNSYDKLAKYPILKRVWAGYAFSVDFNEERGHFYALTDQKETKRQEVVKQPAACANCHAGEAPLLIARWAGTTFNTTPYKEIWRARCTRAPRAPTATTRTRWSCASAGPHSRTRWRRAASI